jgi:hypothetical protein
MDQGRASETADSLRVGSQYRGHVTPCPDEDAANRYQAEHGGEVVRRNTYEVTWANPDTAE